MHTGQFLVLVSLKFKDRTGENCFRATGAPPRIFTSPSLPIIAAARFVRFASRCCGPSDHFPCDTKAETTPKKASSFHRASVFPHIERHHVAIYRNLLSSTARSCDRSLLIHRRRRPPLPTPFRRHRLHRSPRLLLLLLDALSPSLPSHQGLCVLLFPSRCTRPCRRLQPLGHCAVLAAAPHDGVPASSSTACRPSHNPDAKASDPVPAAPPHSCAMPSYSWFIILHAHEF